MMHMHNPCFSKPWGLCPSSNSPHNMFPHVLERLGPCPMPPINTTTHTTCLYATHKVIVISPLVLVHAFSQPTLTQCLAHSITTAQPYLALQPLSPYTRNQQLSHSCHVPPHRVITTCCCPSSQPSLPTMALIYYGLGASCGARCLHMLSLITVHRFNSSREIGLVPLKEPLGASLVRYKEP